ncbi:MAG: FAD-linked oxidoreductase [Arenicella sp.]|jgi:FAD-linked oxidoreductase
MSYRTPHISRRAMLKTVGTSIAASSALTACSGDNATPLQRFSDTPPVLGPNGRPVLPWSNWSGNQRSQPTQRSVPRSEEQLVALIKESKQPIRCVGAGHSFSPLVPTDDTLISLARFRGLNTVDQLKKQATFGAGTLLGQTGEPLWDQGLALRNMPDINTQSLAGAIATSTHGTGSSYGSLSNDVVALRMITADGERLNCSATENPQIYHAARNNLGSLGVVTEVTLTVRDAFNVDENQWILPNQEAYPLAEKYFAEGRRFELYAFPYGDYSMIITLDETDKPIDDKHDQADSGDSLLELKKWTERLPWLRGFLVNSALQDAVGPLSQRINRSYKVFGNLRNVGFNEMEYSLAAEHGMECLQEVLYTIKKQKIDVVFPIEYRYVKGDDIWLSQFYQRDSCSISIHNFSDRDYSQYFAAIEPVFLKYGGRPHWGKLHTLTADTFAEKYPRWQDFKRIRSELDPKGLFLNRHIKELFI